MKTLLALVCVLTWSGMLSAAERSDGGALLITNFATAPFPHPARAEGHTYKKEKFPASEHYSDNSVAIFVPPGFREGTATDFVVHFHGWRGVLTNVLSHYHLTEQLVSSGRNAILIVPQGPKNAPDSFGGKLEDADGFRKFMEEAVGVLEKRGVLHSNTIGKIILSGHSGGYQVISSIVAQGGLTSHVQEVWLFDALYARTEKFANWFASGDRRFIDIYTAHGGTMEETEKLMADLKAKGTAFLQKNEPDVTPADLKANRLIFLYTTLAHNEVIDKHNTFESFLKTSCLAPLTADNGTIAPPRRDVPGKPASADLPERAPLEPARQHLK